MRYFKVLVITLLISCSISYAQTNPTEPVVTPVKKFKAPPLKTQLSIYKDSVSLSVEEAKNVIAAALKVTDDKKNDYRITYYNFLYRRRVVTEDEKTGQAIPTEAVVSDDFNVTPLPALWISTIKDQLRSGEELFFFDIIVKDAQGRVMYAPNFRIKVK
jgi:hypothetical protein